MPEATPIALTVNGEPMRARVPARLNLADFLRHDVGLTGTHVGCEHGVCGACTVLVDGKLARSCLMLAVQCDGASIETIEGADASGRLAKLQQAFHRRNALQCGFCTPAMLLTAAELLRANPEPTREEVRDWISGNFCRCTGYHAIVDAVIEAAS
jgi:aerobic-type carbon monoxide dehydrogenase small subunit (CoxS/CutS family)